MRIALEIDGESRTVEVDLDRGTVRFDGRSGSFRIVEDASQRVEIEIDGERVIVEGWPAGLPAPLEGLAVSGERVRARVLEVDAGIPERSPPATEPAAKPAPSVVPATGPGTSVAPPMPGKVLEVRVTEGERVVAGQLLLILEAMKMRNDVLAPVAGVVRELRAVAGANVRAREPLLRILPD